jgi:crossover junction endodeoxyribonuclease RuvC
VLVLALGLDPGTATTGYGLVRLEPDGSLLAVKYGVITTPKNTPAPERLVTLYNQMKVLLQEHHPETAAVEKLFFQRNVTTALAVGQARGVMLLALAKAGLEVYEYAPNEIKQAVAGYGSAGKRQMQEMVRVLLALDDIPRPDDAADALAVAICHLHSARMLYLTREGD